MPARITATFNHPPIVEEYLCGVTRVIPGVTIEVECAPDGVTDALAALDCAVADVKAQLAAADPMRVIESAPPAQDTPRT